MLGKFTSPAPALNKKQSSGGSSEADAALSTDGPAGGDGGGDSGLVAKLQELLLRERTAHAEAKNDLQVERDAHDDTAEKMVELQQRLEVTLQELSNLERFVKRQQVVAGAAAGAGASDARAERLLKEEAYLKSRLAFVQQEPVLFGVTVRENVAYALAAADARHARAGHLTTAATRTQAEQEGSLQARVEQACRKAHAHAFISELPDGYDTLVGERGVKLSGGQKQRLAIARALLAQPRILLLDEATSALDAESERLVQKAIDEASAGRSVIVVAHRLSTVRDADQIAVMSQGVIADCGTHAELIERCDMYQTLVQRQMSGAPAAAPE